MSKLTARSPFIRTDAEAAEHSLQLVPGGGDPKDRLSTHATLPKARGVVAAAPLHRARDRAKTRRVEKSLRGGKLRLSLARMSAAALSTGAPGSLLQRRTVQPLLLAQPAGYTSSTRRARRRLLITAATAAHVV
jgi:hypothetical protein